MAKPFIRKHQFYEPDVEAALEASARLTQALRRLTEFLIRRAGSEWDGSDGLLDEARDDIRTAAKWLEKARRIGRRRDVS